MAPTTRSKRVPPQPQARVVEAVRAYSDEERQKQVSQNPEAPIHHSSRDVSSITAHINKSFASLAIGKERRSVQEAAVKTDSTPVKPGSGQGTGLVDVTRQHIQAGLLAHLHSRWSESNDLVESMFGPLIGTDFAADILYEFLAMGLLSVASAVGQFQPLAQDHWKSACEYAAERAIHAARSQARSTTTDSYRWKWEIDPEAGEKKSALFMNVIAIAAHAAALRVTRPSDGEDVSDHMPPPPLLRFVTMFFSGGIPLSDPDLPQDCRPDVLGLKTEAFVTAPSTESDRYWKITDDSPFDYIVDKLPRVLQFPANLSADPAVVAFGGWFNEQRLRTHLDLSQFCWPNVQVPLEAKLQQLPEALRQVLVYMRQQRRTQPWMRFVWGLAITTSYLVMLRADTLGVEHCKLSKTSSRGVLDIVRIAFGIVSATREQRGQHESFTLSKTETAVPSKGDPFSADIQYTHDVARFIHLRGDKLHYAKDGDRSDVDYYVHYVMPDSGSLVGRCTHVFCVSRQMKPGEADFDDKGPTLQYIGPYVLKVYNADHRSDCYLYNLINTARQHEPVRQTVLLPNREWRYGDALTKRGYDQSIVEGYTADGSGAGKVPTVGSNREEIFAESDMKRVLAQCDSYEEFGAAFVGFAEGITALAEAQIVHRDLSIGNVLLRRDVQCADKFFDDAAAEVRRLTKAEAKFKQRAFNDVKNAHGGILHDMDMAGRLHPDAVKEPPPGNGEDEEAAIKEHLQVAEAMRAAESHEDITGAKEPRTGTPPFMAIDLLKNSAPHKVEHDFHSLLFVMVLFYWSYPTFLDAQHAFPWRVPPNTRRWPDEVLDWANRQSSLNEQGTMKSAYFENPVKLNAAFVRTLKDDLWMNDNRFLKLFWTLYYKLWSKGTNHPVRDERLFFSPSVVLDALRGSQTDKRD